MKPSPLSDISGPHPLPGLPVALADISMLSRYGEDSAM